MDKQVLDIEQSKHLKELGVEKINSDKFWVKYTGNKYAELKNICKYGEFIVKTRCETPISQKVDDCEVIPTFTIQDILDLLPREIEKDDKNYCLNIFRNYKTYFVSYHWGNNILISFEDELFINAAYKLLCWCIENGYITTNEFKHESNNNL